MIRYFLLLFTAFSLLFFTACTEDKLSFVTENFEQISNISCADNCTKINLEIDVAHGNFVADSINAAVFNKVKNIVYFGEIPLDASEYSDLTNSFIKAYDDFKTDFPTDLMVSWEATVKTKLQYQNEDFIQMKIEYYTFTGGAHGMFAQEVLSFDSKSGKLLSTEDFFKDLEGLKNFAAARFRSEYKIPIDQSLADAGYFFQNEDFVLPQNLFFSQSGIVFHYNVYEIASYAQGVIILEFTNEELKPFLNFKINELEN